MGNFTSCWRLKRLNSDTDRNSDSGSGYHAVNENISPPSAIAQENSITTLNRTGSLQRNASFKVRTLSRSLSYRRNISTTQDFLCAEAYEQNADTVPRGTALLLEFNDFDTDFKTKYGLSSLPNAGKDIGDLSDVFLRAGYNVDRRVNVTVKEARNVIKDISNATDQSNPDSFICVILTHILLSTDGSKQYLACFDDYISCRKLLNPLRKSRCLSGVPKIIFINFSLKVNNLVKQVLVHQYVEESDRATACASVFPGIDYAPVDADFLILYADCSKVCSPQYPELGSYCVQKLSSLLYYNSRHRDFPLMDLLPKLNRYLHTAARISATEEKSALLHSEPLVVISTLRKDFHLFRAVHEKAE